MKTIDVLEMAVESSYNECMKAYYDYKNECVYETYSEISTTFAYEAGAASDSDKRTIFQKAKKLLIDIGNFFKWLGGQVVNLYKFAKGKVVGFFKGFKDMKSGKVKTEYLDGLDLTFKDVETGGDVVIEFTDDESANKKAIEQVEEIIKESMEVLEETTEIQSEVNSMIEEANDAIEEEKVDECKEKIEELKTKQKYTKLVAASATHNFNIVKAFYEKQMSRISSIKNNLKSEMVKRISV